MPTTVTDPPVRTVSETCADTAKRIRVALKTQHPGVKFSVRSHTYAGGASIRVGWVDGPAERGVHDFLQQFAGATFDGSIDLQSYRGPVLTAMPDGTKALIRSGADYVQTSRDISQEWRKEVAEAIATVTGQPCDLTQYGDTDPNALGKQMMRNGDGWRARYNAYVVKADCPACIYGTDVAGDECKCCEGRGELTDTAEVVPAGDTPQAYGRDLFAEATNISRVTNA